LSALALAIACWRSDTRAAPYARNGPRLRRPPADLSCIRRRRRHLGAAPSRMHGEVARHRRFVVHLTTASSKLTTMARLPTPTAPESAQQNPEEPVGGPNDRVSSTGQGGKLLAKGEVLGHEVASRAQGRAERGREGYEDAKHRDGEDQGPRPNRQWFPPGRGSGEAHRGRRRATAAPATACSRSPSRPALRVRFPAGTDLGYLRELEAGTREVKVEGK
jgi:hypothetical protein